jgi:hypothetical protein
MGRTNKSRRKGGSTPKYTASSLVSDSSGLSSYQILLRLLCSVTMHPLGFLLIDFLHPRKVHDDLLLTLPPELVDGLEPTLTKEAYELRAASQQNKETAYFEASLTGWFVSGGNEEDLVKSLSCGMQEVWDDDDALYSKSLRRFKGARDGKRSPDSSILVQRKIHVEKGDRDPAALLIEVGSSQRHSLAITCKAICSTLALLNRGVLREPMLMVVVRPLSHQSAHDFPGAQLVVFLVVPRENHDFRMALLWRGTPGTARAMASDLARIMRITEYVAEWNRLNPNVDIYESLGPHCCRIGEKVGLDSHPCTERPSLANNLTSCLPFDSAGVSVLRQPVSSYGAPPGLVFARRGRWRCRDMGPHSRLRRSREFWRRGREQWGQQI